jgi:hypothetical protein
MDFELANLSVKLMLLATKGFLIGFCGLLSENYDRTDLEFSLWDSFAIDISFPISASGGV